MENNTQNLIEQLESEVSLNQEELSNIKDVVCSHIICPSCRDENNGKEERRKILLETIRVKNDLIDSLRQI